MKTFLQIGAVCAAIAFSGCATSMTDQSDETETRFDPLTGTNVVTQVKRTKTSSQALLAGKQSMKAQRVSQSDKTQTASVGAFNQESDASPLVGELTRFLQTLQAIQSGPLAGLMTPSSRAAAPAASGGVLVPDGWYLAPIPESLRGGRSTLNPSPP